ncbi:L-seryl-tRNA(Sec) selenium transferase [uncultured Sphaerochaeta sp.]|uniref:L-seryl-tRNA(Sec) selenium transferase n=1 Tax=uncultured Sphaerochaeta sp. TaxID=886478 RepID=UPI0029CA2395|nr:L-seryl-tRNA(Sec) selenium transferase [uncultured Sphaerochaeta sp.]
MNATKLSGLPQIEVLLSESSLSRHIAVMSRPLVADTIRVVLERIRGEVIEKGMDVPDRESILSRISLECEHREKDRIQRVINATGVIIHTNMGRSPLNRQIWERAEEINCGYSNLELDLLTGKRGKRKGLIPMLLSSLTGAEDALVVNNNAAAVYLILATFAKDRKVIVSRGEQVQIGGGFRVPEILKATGAGLVEVGTTNITTFEDYAEAVTPETAMILSVHRSNFAIRGFESTPSVKELSSLKNSEVLLCVDQGSGVINEKIPGEISVKSHLSQGADLVCFSGDKIFSGPQAGIIVGRKGLIAQLETHPLMRVFRPGKTIYSLLEMTLISYLNGDKGHVAQKLLQPYEELKKKGENLLEGLDKSRFSLEESTCTSGGGTAPDETFPSFSVVIAGKQSPQTILERLRDSSPPIIATIHDERVHLNMATMEDEDIPHVHEVLMGFKN